MNKLSFFAFFFLAAFRHIGSVVISIILLIIGAICSKVCFYIGLFLLVTNVVVALIYAFRMQSSMKYRSDDNPEFNEMMEKLSSDPKAFLEETMEAQEKNRQLHGEDLLTLSDDDLFETIYFQNIDIAEEAEDEDKEIEQFAGARKTVYVLGLFDSELQNGGLCQFFVNSSRVVAPYVSEALRIVGADEHLNLFEAFVAANNIDVSDLTSFKVSGVRGYVKQTKRFDFDSFDEKYYELPALQDKVVAYIRNNINEF